MNSLLILLVSVTLISRQCNDTLYWFNRNHPWDPQSNGNDIERFSLIQAMYPPVFEFSRWTGYIEIRSTLSQRITNGAMLIESYTKISDGFICHAINGKLCVDYEIGFCLQPNSCGISKDPSDEIFITDVDAVRPHSIPWHVSIQYDEKHICDGTLIDDQHVLTSARCLQKRLILLPYSVVLSPRDLSNSMDRFSVDSFTFHRDFNVQTLENDIGVIKLSRRISKFSDRLIPACVVQSIRQPSGSNPLLAASWHAMVDGTWSTTEFRHTMLTVVDECSRAYDRYDSRRQLCVSNEDSKRDSYLGDHGDGLFEEQKYDVDRWVLTGIASYGCEYSVQGYPGVYTRVSTYYDWIQNTIENMK